MPKKTASTRSGASRNRPKPQKSIQLVQPNAPVTENDIPEDESSAEETTLSTPTSKATVATTATVSKSEVATTKKTASESATPKKEPAAADTTDASRSSAAARLAARRQNPQKQQQVSRGANLITVEHYAYVKRDLIYILILAIIMFSAIIILHFVPAIGG